MSRSLLPTRTQLTLEGLQSPLLIQPGEFLGEPAISEYVPFIELMRSAVSAGSTSVEWSAASPLSAVILRNILAEHDYWVSNDSTLTVTASWSESNPYPSAYTPVDPAPMIAQVKAETDRVNAAAAAARDLEQGAV